jgi:hypothetical protein
MFIMMTGPKKTADASVTIAALATLLVSFWAFRWGFIHIWERQHEGRRMIFVFGPDGKASVLAILVSIAVFFFFRRS